MNEPSSTAAKRCPSCGAAANGRFCASCGTALGSTACSACGATLSDGARYCHACGTPVAGAAPPPAAKRDLALPWAFAAIALVALVAVFAAQRFGAAGNAQLDAPLGSAQQTPLNAMAAGARASDISGLSERERASRLYDRVMLLSEERRQDSLDFAAAGKEDSLQFFAQMAIQAHLIIQPRDADVRYDLGRIAQVAGAPQIARVQADSILAAEPTHLLGLILATSSARQMGDAAAADAFERRLLAAAPTEENRARPEYSAHRNDIIAAVEEARARGAAP
ncbi:MAG TPA: zinc ribbon domain-containing protein [Gemmatimonadaceae bacterium]|nr:zinc ribbon domain-containing protein [Gemmatimonadaceae bacterium]